jgi:hypothetical protein
MVLTDIAVMAEHLEAIGKLVFRQPEIQRLAAATLAVGSAIIVHVVDRQEQRLGFPAAGADVPAVGGENAIFQPLSPFLVDLPIAWALATPILALLFGVRLGPCVVYCLLAFVTHHGATASVAPTMRESFERFDLGAPMATAIAGRDRRISQHSTKEAAALVVTRMRSAISDRIGILAIATMSRTTAIGAPVKAKGIQGFRYAALEASFQA